MDTKPNHFRNYLSTHFEKNCDLSPARIRAEFNIFDLNFKRFLQEDRYQTILEIGFGTGYFLKYLLEQGYKQFLGIEVSPEAVEFVKKNITDRAQYVEDTTSFLTQHHQTYQTIIMFDVLEHIPKSDTVHFLQNVRDSLQRGGIFIARVPNGSNPLNIQSFVDDFTHEWIYSTSSLKQVCLLAGFRDVRVFPVQEENLTWQSVLNNITQKLIIATIKRLMKFSRVYLNEESFYTKNIFCVCKKI